MEWYNWTMESMVWWWHTIVVSQLCDSTIWNGMIELWRACYGECELWDSFNCVMAPYAMVQLYYGDESIVCLSYWQQGMVVVDHDSQLIVWWNNVIWFSWAMRRPSLCVWAMESMLWWWWTMVIFANSVVVQWAMEARGWWQYTIPSPPLCNCLSPWESVNCM
jgi:hypothetical protein